MRIDDLTPGPSDMIDEMDVGDLYDFMSRFREIKLLKLFTVFIVKIQA